MTSRFTTFSALALFMLLSVAEAFAPPMASSALVATLPTVTVSSLSTAAAAVTFPSLTFFDVASSSSSSLSLSSSAASSSPALVLAAATVDPTTFLSDVLGGLIGTPLILAVPIVAALAIASLVAFFIISYANPEVEDDE